MLDLLATIETMCFCKILLVLLCFASALECLDVNIIAS